MPKKRFGAEQIVTLLRQIEVSMAPAQNLTKSDVAAHFMTFPSKG
jgi:hypothetical protein